MYELKIYRGVTAMIMNNDAEFEEEFTYCLKFDLKNLTNFDLRT